MKYYLFHKRDDYTFICEEVESNPDRIIVNVISIPWRNRKKWDSDVLDKWVSERSYVLNRFRSTFFTQPLITPDWILGSECVSASDDYDQLMSEAAILQL